MQNVQKQSTRKLLLPLQVTHPAKRLKRKEQQKIHSKQLGKKDLDAFLNIAVLSGTSNVPFQPKRC